MLEINFEITALISSNHKKLWKARNNYNNKLELLYLLNRHVQDFYRLIDDGLRQWNSEMAYPLPSLYADFMLSYLYSFFYYAGHFVIYMI